MTSPKHPDPAEYLTCSVIIRTQNRPRHLHRALTSIAEQLRQPDEVVIVNDGGECISGITDAFPALPLKIIVNQHSIGRARAGNQGVKACRGQAICFLDDDDRFFPDHLKRLELCFSQFDAKVAYAGSQLVQKDLLGDRDPQQNRMVGQFNDPFDALRLEFENYIPLNTLMIHRDLFCDVGGFDAAFNLFEDWDLLIRLSRKTRFYHLERVTSEYAVWGKSQQITLLSSSDQWREAYHAVFNKHFLSLPDFRKTRLMADYWIISQDRRSQVKALQTSLEQCQAQISQLTQQQAQTESRLQEEQTRHASQLEAQRLEYESRLNTLCQQYRADHLQWEQITARKLRALKAGVMQMHQGKQKYHAMIFDYRSNLPLDFGNEDICKLLNINKPAAGFFDSVTLRAYYQQLVDWVKEQDHNWTQTSQTVAGSWQSILEKTALLEHKVSFLLSQLHHSRLRKIWRGIPIPQVSDLLNNIQGLQELLSSPAVNPLQTASRLLLPEINNLSADSEAAPVSLSLMPVLEIISGQDGDTLHPMLGSEASGTTQPVILNRQQQLCFQISCPSNYFSGLKIMFGTFGRINTCTIWLRIYQDGLQLTSLEPLRSCEFNAIDLLDNQSHVIRFEPIPDSEQVLYRIEMTSPNATPHECVAVWCHTDANARWFQSSRNAGGQFPNRGNFVSPRLFRLMSNLLRENHVGRTQQSNRADAHHTFWIYNFFLNSQPELTALLLELIQQATDLEQTVAFIVYGRPDPAIQAFCEAAGLAYLVPERSVFQKHQVTIWALEQARQCASGGLHWFVSGVMQPEKDLLRNAEMLLQQHPHTGLILPLIKDSTEKVANAFAQMTRSGYLHPYPHGMALDHPVIRCSRVVDAALTPFGILPASALQQFRIPPLQAYTTACYQVSELMWQLHQQGLEARFDAGICFKGTRWGEAVPQTVLQNDQQLFATRWQEYLAHKPPMHARVFRLMNPQRQPTMLIVDFLPAFDEDSGSLRRYETLIMLVELGFKLTFLAFNGIRTEKHRRALELLGIEVFNGDYGLAPALHDRDYNAILLARVEIGFRYMQVIKVLNPGARIYYDTVDIHYLREQRQADIENNADLYQRAAFTRQKELSNCVQADVVLTVTAEDQQHLVREIPALKCFVLPNIHRQMPSDMTWAKTEGLVFIGNYNHPPNQDAVFYFVEHVLPLIRAEIPDIRLYLIGSFMRPKMQALASDAIRVLGWVEDVEPELMKRRVMVSYLRYGSGMKGKIGQAMALGLPVVSTAIGAEGMELEDQKTVMLANDPKTFADRVVQLYTQQHFWEAISRNARSDIQNRFGPAAIKYRLAAFLEGDLKSKINA